jgi:uncharacterized protein YceH (UPF0502 family)
VRRPGQKEERYVQLLSGEGDMEERAPPLASSDETQADSATLEQRVARLERELAALQSRVGPSRAEHLGR